MARKNRSPRRSRAIPRATFERLVREITQELKVCSGEDPHSILWSADAMNALHDDAESFLSEHFQKAHYVCENFKKRTLHPQHFEMAQALSYGTSESSQAAPREEISSASLTPV